MQNWKNICKYTQFSINSSYHIVTLCQCNTYTLASPPSLLSGTHSATCWPLEINSEATNTKPICRRHSEQVPRLGYHGGKNNLSQNYYNVQMYHSTVLVQTNNGCQCRHTNTQTQCDTYISDDVKFYLISLYLLAVIKLAAVWNKNQLLAVIKNIIIQTEKFNRISCNYLSTLKLSAFKHINKQEKNLQHWTNTFLKCCENVPGGWSSGITRVYH